MRRARVKHEQLKAVAFEVEDLLLHAVHRAQARSAIQTDCMVGGAAHRRVLVKATGGGARHVVLGGNRRVDQGHTAFVGIAEAL